MRRFWISHRSHEGLMPPTEPARRAMKSGFDAVDGSSTGT
jgi:hypothetical protein